MTDNLINVLDQYTALTKDVDLFYLEMPLGKAGLWFADRQTDASRTGYKEYDIYYRGKTKQSAIQNIAYLKNTLDNLEECSINGEIFKLQVLFEWDFLEKDAEGYYVFANSLRLL